MKLSAKRQHPAETGPRSTVGIAAAPDQRLSALVTAAAQCPAASRLSALQRSADLATAPLQARFKKGGQSFSFLSAYDANGNPFVASRGAIPSGGKGSPAKKQKAEEKNYSIEVDQPNINLKEVDDLHIPLASDKDKMNVKHNLSMGRQQRVDIGGQKSIIEPFKTYTFGPSKVPDVAVYDVSGGNVEAAKFYSDFQDKLTDLTKDAKKEKNMSKLDVTKLEPVRREMGPLIFAEDFRASGAEDKFAKRWEKLLDAVEAAKQTPGTKEERKDARERLTEAISGATTDLPWAGTGGKKNFRKGAKGRGQWEEEKRDIGRRGMSPEPESVGGKRKKPDM